MTDVKEQLRAYFDEVDPPFDPAGLMREPQPQFPLTRRPVGRGVLIAGTAAAVLLLVLALPLLFLANGSETAVEPSATTTEAPTTTTEPTSTTSAPTTAAPDQVIGVSPDASAEVFSWTGDDISDWVTEEEMAAALAGLLLEYAGTELHGEVEFERREVFGEASDTVEWTVGHEYGENHWVVTVHNGDHLPDDLWSYETDLELPKGEITTGGWGVFTVRGPNSDESLCVWVGPPVEIFGGQVQEDIYEEMISVLASMILEELGWVD